MLRSKSGDGDSYNAGDYFNRIDFSLKTNNWGIGLPSKEKTLTSGLIGRLDYVQRS